jgi:hypothetical protein
MNRSCRVAVQTAWFATTGLLWLAAPLLAEDASRTGAIVGEIASVVTSQPLTGALIAVDGTARITLSDSAGRFRIEALPIGTYRLLVSKEGFLPRREADVVVTVDRDTPVSLRLQDAPARAETVEVTASYFATPEDVATGAFAMTYEEVRRAPGALGDVSRMIQSLPSAMVRDDARNDIVARGGSPSENLILVDGLEVPNLSHFAAQGVSGGAISMLNTELIGEASFMAGGFPAPYGQRLSSVLEIGLREGNRKHFKTEFDLGIAGAGLVAEGPIGRRGSWIASARRSYFDLVASAFNVADVPLYSNYQTKAVYQLNARNRLSFVSLGGWEKIHEDVPWEDADNPDVMIVDDVGWRTASGLNLQTLLGTRGVGTLSLAHNESAFSTDAWDRTLESQQVEHNRSRERESTAKYDLTYAVPRLGSVRAGAYAKRLGASYDLVQPLGVDNPYAIEVARLNALALRDRFAAAQIGGYLQLSHRLGGLAALTLGGRYDYFGLRRAARVSPRAGFALHLTRKLDLTASAGRYYQMPALVLMKATASNAGLDPIRADHYVAGLSLYPRPDMKVTVEAYRKHYTGYPVSTEIPSLSLASAGDSYDAESLMMPAVSAGRGRASGLEVYVQKKLTRALWGQASYAYSRTQQRALDGIWRPSAFDLPHVLSLVAGYKIGHGLETSAKFSYSSGRPDTPLLLSESAAQNRLVYDVTQINAERVPSYSRLDVRVDKRYAFKWGGLVFYVEADNVYNRKNVRQYVWNAKTGQRQAWEQLRFLAIGGVNVEF